MQDSRMKDAIAKADSLVEAHQYIRRFKDKTVVVKVGGSIMDQPEALHSLLADICFMDEVGINPILVHGGGKNITQAMKAAGIEAHFVQGRRYTDERTLAIAEHVLANEVNGPIVDYINESGHQAMGLHSLASCVVFAKRLFLDAPGEGDSAAGNRKIDIGFVGQVEKVNAVLLEALQKAETIPVIAPVARDESGGKLNVNADSVAGHVAAAVRAEKIVLVSDTHGIRMDADDAESVATHLTKAQIEQMIEDGVVDGGMLPKVEASFTALEGGVKKAHIVDGRIAHSLLLEIYTNSGIGTEIVLD